MDQHWRVADPGEWAPLLGTESRPLRHDVTNQEDRGGDCVGQVGPHSVAKRPFCYWIVLLPFQRPFLVAGCANREEVIS